MSLVYRTTGAWGAGKGAALTATEIDSNFYQIMERISGLTTDPAQPLSIAGFTISGRNFTVTMSDASTRGPFELPLAVFKWRGAWASFEPYAALDMFYSDDMGLYIVLTAHTSGYSFDPVKNISGSNVYSQIFGPTTIYDISFFLPGIPGHSLPVGSPVMQLVAGRAFIIPQSSQFISAGGIYMAEAPTADLIFNLSLASQTETIGAIHVAAGSNLGYLWVPASVEVVEQDVLIISQADSPSGADLSVTIRALRGTTLTDSTESVGAFIVSAAAGAISRDTGILEIGHNLVDGTVLKFTDTLQLAPLSADDFETEALLVGVTLAGILIGDMDSTSIAKSVLYIARLAEVDSAWLTYFSGVISGEEELVAQAFVPRAVIFRDRSTAASPLVFQDTVSSVAGLIGAISAGGLKSALAIAAGDISGLAASATTNALNASNISSGTLPTARLPNPTASTLGGVESIAAESHKFMTSISTSGAPALAQPISADITGTATNDNAASGYIGQIIESKIAAASGVSLTTETGADMTNISLTAGDWDVSGGVNFAAGSGAYITVASMQVSITSGTLDQDDALTYLTNETSGLGVASALPTKRLSLSTTTTVYAAVSATFTGGTCKASGRLTARRAR